MSAETAPLSNYTSAVSALQGEFRVTIKIRLKAVIAAETRDRTRYVQLKELTGISGDIWKNFWFDRREPDAIMIEAVSRRWPKYAYWLATGATNVACGHVCPASQLCFETDVQPSITSEAFFGAGIDLAIYLDEVLTSSTEEEQEGITTHIHNFLRGDSLHRLNARESIVVDEIFKKIKAFNRAGYIRMKEEEMKKPT